MLSGSYSTEWFSSEQKHAGANSRHLELLEQFFAANKGEISLRQLAHNLVVEGDYNNLWGTLLRGVRKFPQLTGDDRLAELSFETLLGIGAYTSCSSKVLMAPFLKALTEDFWGASAPHRTPDSYDQQWLNLNTFAARLFMHWSFPQSPIHTLQGAAGYTLVDALEQHPWTDFPLLERESGPMDNGSVLSADSSKNSYTHSSCGSSATPSMGPLLPRTSFSTVPYTNLLDSYGILELKDVGLLNNTIPAAAIWIKKAGERLYELSGDMDYGTFFEIPEDWQRSDFGDELGWSKERFGFWKERFELISNLEAEPVTQVTRDLAKEAAKTMQDIEENPRSCEPWEFTGYETNLLMVHFVSGTQSN